MRDVTCREAEQLSRASSLRSAPSAPLDSCSASQPLAVMTGKPGLAGHPAISQ